MLRAGVAKVEVTPPVGVRMSGFAGRAFPSMAVHDPLCARALVLDDGRRRAALVTMDLIGISEKAVAKVREEAASSAGIAQDGLLLAGTHTHSGPTFWDDGTFTAQERGYWDELPGRLAAVLKEAADSLTPARLGWASGWSAVGINRRETVPGGLVTLGRDHFGRFDPELGLIRVDRADGAPLAGLMNYACHAVCLVADNYLLSADYPGFAAYRFERAIGGGVMGLFFNGACGNINPREAAVGHGVASGGSFTIAQRAGEHLAREAARVWKQAEPREDIALSFARKQVALPTNRARAIKAAEEGLQQAEQRAAYPHEELSPYVTWYDPPNPERARKRLERLKAEGDAPVKCEIQAIVAGPVAFVGWPGEIFCELGMMVKEASPFRPTYTIGYANGSIGYVPTPEAFPQGGYEVGVAAHLADNAGLVLVQETLGLLKGVNR